MRTLNEIIVLGSHALRVRGLKLFQRLFGFRENSVARSTRAWIETALLQLDALRIYSRTLYACVD